MQGLAVIFLRTIIATTGRRKVQASTNVVGPFPLTCLAVDAAESRLHGSLRAMHADTGKCATHISIWRRCKRYVVSEEHSGEQLL